MKQYTTEVEFLRAEVEKCHASMHSQIETINLLMKKNIALKEQKREWVGLTDEELSAITSKVIGFNSCVGWEEDYAKAIENKLREKNGG